MNLTPTQSTTRAIGTELVDAELPGRIFRRHGAFQPSLQRKPITTSVISIPAEPSHGPVPESTAARSTTTTTATHLVALELLTATALAGTGSGPEYSTQNDAGDLSSPNAVSATGAAQTAPE